MRSDDDSQVVDALKQGYNLERVLRALRCDVAKDDGSPFESKSGYIRCPMPEHPDNSPSCQVLEEIGCFECWSLCSTIRPLDLIVAHGAAPDRAGAAKWVEDLLGIKPADKKPPVPIVDDPSLTVREYLAMRSLPDWIAERFGLEDVHCWAPGVDRGTANVSFETGWFGSVLMPLREGRRPRVRWAMPKSKLRWAPKVRRAGGPHEDYTLLLVDGGPAIEWPQDLIGMDQFASSLSGGNGSTALPVLIIVEGESDVHACHAMSLPYVVGVPGSKNVKKFVPELREAALKAVGGDAALLPTLSVVVWREPGKAGSQFPGDVAKCMTEAMKLLDLDVPQIRELDHSSIQGKPKDPATLLTTLPYDVARQRLIDAVFACALGGAAVEQPDGPAPLSPGGNAQIALEAVQVDGAHTPPPATELTVEQILAAAPPEGPPVELPPSPSLVPPSYMQNEALADAAENMPDWGEYDDCEAPPARELSPVMVEGASTKFYRCNEGWQVSGIDKNGDPTYKIICSPFVVEAVEESSGEILVRAAVPMGSDWRRQRFPMAVTADAGRTCAQLAALGVRVVNRQRPAVTDLLCALVDRLERSVGLTRVPSGTGWSGRAGVGGFGGLDVEPVNEFGARMFAANKTRRANRPDVHADAVEWWARGVMPLLGPDAVAKPTNGTAAALLAIGAACAAPLVGPLADVGVNVAPVVWIAGLGGGGKTITQKLAATIYAPCLPANDGQIAYFASANISQAALSARVDSCRDLPLILDDVTQLPPAPGSTSKGDAARIEAAASLGMLVFNRKPIERATRDGGIRQTKAFRSTAIFSAEVNMNSDLARAVVTAGQRRRISTIDAKPMTEAGLGQAYAETVNDLAAKVGGAPADVYIPRVRDIVKDRQLRRKFESVRAKISAVPAAMEVTLTQRESFAANVLAFSLMADAIEPGTFEATAASMVRVLAPYIDMAAKDGGATRDDDLGGVQRALAAVDDMLGSQAARFDGETLEDLVMPNPTMGWLGKRLTDLDNGQRRVVLFGPGMDMLNSRYGVTAQVVESAMAQGCAVRGHQVRMSNGARPRGTCWILPLDEPDTDDLDAEPTDAPHDTDPYNLASPVNTEEAAVPTFNLGGAPLTVPDDHPLAIPLSKLDMSEAYGMQFTWTVDGQPTATIEGAHERVIIYQEGFHMNNIRFLWGERAGLYVIEDVQAAAADPAQYTKVLDAIKADVQGELTALRSHYDNAAAADPQGQLGAPLEVADFPADDDPRWAHIDAIGFEAARAQWAAHYQSLWRANHAATVEEKRAHHELHIKQARVHLMCRYRHPEWFLISEADVPLLDAAA